jgi:cell division protein FtsL
MTAPARPLGAPPARPGLQVVAVRRARRTGPRIGWWVLLAFTVVVAFFALIYSRITLDRSAFVLDEITRQMTVEESRYWDLRLEAARLQAPERIVELAGEMGMVYPEAVQTLTVPGVSTVGTGTEDRWIDLKAILTAQP